MKRIAITGATSFIGKRLVKYASENGWLVTAVVRKHSTKKEDFLSLLNVDIVELNMDEYEQIGEIVGAVDCFVHLAWNGTRGSSRMDVCTQKLNYEYGMIAIRSMALAGCKRIITAGSQAEYGNCDGIITEETVCNPNTQYGKYKLELYKDASSFCEKNGISYKEARIFSLYGPGDYESSLVMSLIKKIKANEDCSLTACTQMWDFLFIDDAVEGLLFLCEKDCPDGAYNLASGEVRPLKEYVNEVADMMGASCKMLFGVIPYGEKGPVSIQPSIGKVSRYLNWKPRIMFQDGIERILAQNGRGE